MAQIINLQTRPDRLRKGQDELLRQAILPLEQEIPAGVLREILTIIDRRSAVRNKWTFVMLSPEQNMKVVHYLAENSRQPVLAMKLWALCFNYLRTDTGEIMLHRDQIADELGTTSDEISRVMSELVEFGAIIRQRQRVKGMRGPGVVQYFMNPRVATHLGGVERERAQEDAPLLRLIENPAS